MNVGVKRIVDTDFWEDEKVIDNFTPEDKYFMVYLLTNPHSKQAGVYKLPKKIMAFQTGYSIETIQYLIERFEKTYQMIKYDHETQEVAIKNYLKYSLIKGGQPVYDCIKSDLGKVDNKKLINYVYKNLSNQFKNTDKKMYQDILKIFETYIPNENDNDNDIYNDNDSIVPRFDNVSSKPKKNNNTLTSIECESIIQFYNATCLNLPKVEKLTDSRKKSINSRTKEHGLEKIKDVIVKAHESDFLSGRTKDWKASFDWLMSPTNFVKVLEGNYQNKYKETSKYMTGLDDVHVDF